MPTVTKRSGALVEYDEEKVYNAIICAMRETQAGIDEQLAHYISYKIPKDFKAVGAMNVEHIQDKIVHCLLNAKRNDVANTFSAYREKRTKTRDKREGKYKLLDDDFISPYKKMSPPMDNLGTFVFYRTYSRWLPEEERREYWWETARRAVEYNCSLDPDCGPDEAKILYDNVFHLRQFLSGRTFWVGGTEVAEKFPMANYNCAFECIDSIESLRDLFYLLMIGSGVGVKLTEETIKDFPKLRTDVRLMHLDYRESNLKGNEVTGLAFIRGVDALMLSVGDSKEGWVTALYHYLDILSNPMYRCVKEIWI
ncbi:MAG: ATP cone domain-containing protein, partial [Sphaerochaetaceae bacterium]